MSVPICWESVAASRSVVVPNHWVETGRLIYTIVRLPFGGLSIDVSMSWDEGIPLDKLRACVVAFSSCTLLATGDWTSMHGLMGVRPDWTAHRRNISCIWKSMHENPGSACGVQADDVLVPRSWPENCSFLSPLL